MVIVFRRKRAFGVIVLLRFLSFNAESPQAAEEAMRPHAVRATREISAASASLASEGSTVKPAVAALDQSELYNQSCCLLKQALSQLNLFKIRRYSYCQENVC